MLYFNQQNFYKKFYAKYKIFKVTFTKKSVDKIFTIGNLDINNIIYLYFNKNDSS